MKIICNKECSHRRKAVKGKGWTLLTSILFLFMPKCALCWAAYMSFLGSFGIVIKYQPWFIPLMHLLFILTLIKLLITSIRSKNFIAFGLAIIAGAIIFTQKNELGNNEIKIIAIILMAIAVLMDKFLQLFRLFKFN